MAIDQATRHAVLFAWAHKCFYCGRHATNVDHIVPRSKQGTDVPNNLIAACSDCNRIKRDLWLPLPVLKETLFAAQQRSEFVTRAAEVLRQAEKLSIERISYGSIQLRDGVPPKALVSSARRRQMPARDLSRMARTTANAFCVLQGA